MVWSTTKHLIIVNTGYFTIKTVIQSKRCLQVTTFAFGYAGGFGSYPLFSILKSWFAVQKKLRFMQSNMDEVLQLIVSLGHCGAGVDRTGAK